MKKKNTGLVVTIIILVILILALGGYICYDKFYLDKKDNNKIVETNKDCETTINENKENTTTTSNSFSLFAKTLKENRAKQKEKDKQSGLTINGDTHSANLEEIGNYDIKLDYNGTLSVTYGNKNYKKYNTTIDTNVLLYKMVYAGNGGFKWLYYVKDDGKLYSADVEYGPYSENKKAESKVKEGYQDIILISNENITENVNGNVTGFKDAVFVDINGKVYYLSERGK